MGSKQQVKETLKEIKFFIIAISIVVVLAVVVVLAIEFNPNWNDNKDVNGNNNEKLSKTEYCNNEKGASEICDEIKDCSNGSDETNCPMKNGGVCSEFRCIENNGENQCLSRKKVCDGWKDCIDGSDEINCNSTCGRYEYHCPGLSNDTQCIDSNLVCDNVHDCPDGADEYPCAEWLEWSGWCRLQRGNDTSSCTLIRSKKCRHRVKEMAEEDIGACALFGLDVNIFDFMKSCNDVTDFDAYATELCPAISTKLTTNESLPSLGEIQDFIGMLEDNNPHQAKENMSSSSQNHENVTTQSSKHVYSAIVGIFALTVCVILSISAYCTTKHEHQESYNVSVHESKEASLNTPDDDFNGVDLILEHPDSIARSISV
uniref:low-density lipoprotein receptor-related protein 2-like n=1 Tax=Styela clava TaxID=7725 RepID=UPI00193A4BA7|nr:low-density lipoprotein receptor-related protein 2-like [Styela clava]